MKRYLEIAKITATHGIRGEVRCQYYCDAPEVLCEFDTLYLDNGKRAVEIERAYPHKNIVVMKIAGADTVKSRRRNTSAKCSTWTERTQNFPKILISFKT